MLCADVCAKMAEHIFGSRSGLHAVSDGASLADVTNIRQRGYLRFPRPQAQGTHVQRKWKILLFLRTRSKNPVRL